MAVKPTGTGANKAIIFSESLSPNGQTSHPMAAAIKSAADAGKAKRGRPPKQEAQPSLVFNVRTYTKKSGAWVLNKVAGSTSQQLDSKQLAQKLAEYQDTKSLTPIYIQNVTQFRPPSSPRALARPVNLTYTYLYNNAPDGINSGVVSDINYVRAVPLSKNAEISDEMKQYQFDLGALPRSKVNIENRKQLLVKDSTANGSAFNMYVDHDLTQLGKLFDLVDRLTILPIAKTKPKKEEAKPAAKK